MRMYRKQAGPRPRIDYATELIEGLGAFEPTAAFAAPLEGVNAELEAKFEERAKLRQKLPKARAQLRVAEYWVETTLRRLSRAAEVADRGRCDPSFNGLFPKGVSAEGAVSKSRAATLRNAWAMITSTH